MPGGNRSEGWEKRGSGSSDEHFFTAVRRRVVTGRCAHWSLQLKASRVSRTLFRMPRPLCRRSGRTVINVSSRCTWEQTPSLAVSGWRQRAVPRASCPSYSCDLASRARSAELFRVHRAEFGCNAWRFGSMQKAEAPAGVRRRGSSGQNEEASARSETLCARSPAAAAAGSGPREGGGRRGWRKGNQTRGTPSRRVGNPFLASVRTQLGTGRTVVRVRSNVSSDPVCSHLPARPRTWLADLGLARRLCLSTRGGTRCVVAVPITITAPPDETPKR